MTETMLTAKHTKRLLNNTLFPLLLASVLFPFYNEEQIITLEAYLPELCS